ncbi:hypothetical protein [Hydrogenophaga sp.]|uniref:hypothetical protein n=1 Tax=Hydrogenophaga sp. TaxID=1904254 RepID=UPI002720726B|nr:hypothetical protein [Hydrogenophaga sp.]MDO9436659.1 hypothetical protein [Hydrogenophaga sp.]
MSVRDDLLHLTPEALAHATNAGIVKRAVRELAVGVRPVLELDAQGLLTARFDDGAQCRWAAGISIQNAQCSCGAAGVCRHRVMAVLAYREQAAPDVAASQSEIAAVATASDEALARVVPVALLALARQLHDGGMDVELRRRAGGEPCDTARLPSATVRFWAGPALEAARCDCVRAFACEHVALGLWAFRAADALDAPSAQVRVRLGAQGERHAVDVEPYQQLVNAIVRHGIARGPAALVQSLTSARTASAHATWLALLVADVENWSEAYARRSALYQATDGVDLLAELALRLSAGAQPGQASTVLGLNQAGETALDRLRLMCLGARTQRDGEARRTRLVMADVDTGTRLALSHDWQVPDEQRSEEATLRTAQRVAPGVLLDALAQGQLLAQSAARRPDGSLRLARARSAQNSVLPQSADWGQLASPVRFDSVAALLNEHRAHPVAALQERHAARRFVVFTPTAVEQLAYDVHAQCVQAVLRDTQQHAVLLQRAHERHVPHALDAIADALSGRRGAVRHVAGVLRWDHGVPCLEPWAIACDSVVVPDFANATGALAQLPLGVAHAPSDDPCAHQLEALREHLAQLLHHGLARLPRGWIAGAQQLAQGLDSAGLRALARQLGEVVVEVMAAQSGPADASLAPALMRLLALRQLHADAATLSEPVTEEN